MKRKTGLTLLFVIILSITAYAAKGAATLKVTYNNIKLMVDGAPVKTSTEPFIMENGKIGCSVEDIAKALGKDVKYDPKTTTFYIGKMPSGSWTYISDLKPLNYGGDTIYLNPVEDGREFSIAGKGYIKGLQMLNSSVWDRQTFIDFNLSGEYKSLHGFVGMDDKMRGTRATYDAFIYVDDTLVYTKRGIKPGDFPDEFNIDVTNAIKVTLKAKANRPFVGTPILDWTDLVLNR